ncbi:COG3672 Predicted transglutaminase-like cysteine proteinase [uncultured Caudovirales phage]|uniref:COG3672 Predicted transglutaminase-like cysteine proteinase n=1 Tax=uncultured Caudovirales phage TaxID=2100421 RepID=A0A6J5SNZ0_9CAUD|nr:COG3672 Predicted transglutaminase-like cysteine proteinase [uncultured Caudovirales phage]
MNLDELTAVNHQVNQSDYVLAIDPLWEPIDIDDDGGTCSNYAVAKLRLLVTLDWPKELLRLACCYVETGEYHAVLIASLKGQDYVLDNRTPYPIEVELVGYKWDRIWNWDLNAWEKC